ncbi:hypothetical protein BT63DRAFT_456667 [Microthyrium microscopicum]|uniref:AA1-like domain-containing protein n=1 Tax=Microthyrium microscopicum TaxID=703497 RepID=A0A6A6U7V7_9PEZI|nr:hypothetical protein BT63DRAFT_456667 [Microthyrium microscopicum]
MKTSSSIALLLSASGLVHGQQETVEHKLTNIIFNRSLTEMTPNVARFHTARIHFKFQDSFPATNKSHSAPINTYCEATQSESSISATFFTREIPYKCKLPGPNTQELSFTFVSSGAFTFNETLHDVKTGAPTDSYLSAGSGSLKCKTHVSINPDYKGVGGPDYRTTTTDCDMADLTLVAKKASVGSH